MQQHFKTIRDSLVIISFVVLFVIPFMGMIFQAYSISSNVPSNSIVGRRFVHLLIAFFFGFVSSVK